MIDPVTALATASAAFNVIKKGFEVGRDIESMTGDIGRWMSAVSDIKKSDEYAKKPPLFKKLVNSKSVEEEALQAFMAKKKAEEMRDELRNIISFARGPQAWAELVRMEAEIRKQRQQAIYDQKERQKHLIEVIVSVIVGFLGLGLLIGFVWFLLNQKSNTDLVLTLVQNSGIV